MHISSIYVSYSCFCFPTMSIKFTIVKITTFFSYIYSLLNIAYVRQVKSVVQLLLRKVY